MEKTTQISDEPVIQIDNLVKEYKSSDGTIIRAVNNVSMSVAAGEIVGLLGANGAGKTTSTASLRSALVCRSVGQLFRGSRFRFATGSTLLDLRPIARCHMSRFH